MIQVLIAIEVGILDDVRRQIEVTYRAVFLFGMQSASSE